MKIADVSYYQGTIDWASARKELDFVIIRSSVGLKTDPQYVRNAGKCGLPFGAYHYINAGTAAEAEAEAEYFYHAARGYSDANTLYAGGKTPSATTKEGTIKPLFWVADVEAEAQTRITTEAVVRAFLNKLRALGAEKIGVYASSHRAYMSTELVNSFDWVWIARYGLNTGEADDVNYPPQYACDLWQYTSKGKVSGISGNVDLSKLYGEKPLSFFTGSGSEQIIIPTAGGLSAEAKRQAIVAKYKTILGRNYYSQARRDYCYRKYTDGKYYSDCSSSVSHTYKEAGYSFGILNTVGMYQSNKLKEVPVVIQTGQIQNPEMLRLGDMLLFAGNDLDRGYAGYVGHVEMVYAIDGSEVTLCGHGSGHPSTKNMKTYLKSRYNSKTKTPVGNAGLIKVVRYIQDDESTAEPVTPTPSPTVVNSSKASPQFVVVNDSVASQKPAGVAEKPTVTITGASVNIRSGPGTSYAKKMIAHAGDVFERASTEGWTPILIEDSVYWISSAYVGVNGVCTGKSVNVRKGPGVLYAAVSIVYSGKKLEIPDTGGWIPIIVGDEVLWVSGKYAS